MMKSILNTNPQSFWIDSTEETDYPPLLEDMETDVAIIGGGMVGITTGLLLKEAGLKVIILEADRIVKGTTGHTSAKITSQHGLIYSKIKKDLGEAQARQYADANQSAIRMIARLVEEKSIDCDFSWQPSYIFTQSQDYIQQIMDETTIASSLGIQASYMEEIPLALPIKAAIKFEGQAQFHPRKFLLSLAKEIPGDASYIFEQTKIVDIDRDGSLSVISSQGHKIKADRVIVASHFPFYDRAGLYFTRLYPERSYILGATIKEKFPPGMYINAEEPSRSLRSQNFADKDLVLIGGEHHKTGHGKNIMDHYNNLINFAQGLFELEEIHYRWSAQDHSTPDGLPYIGPLSPITSNIYLATGFQKWGMTTSMVAAILLKDLITRGQSPWESIYNPSRITPSMPATKNFIKQTVDVARNFISGKILTPEMEEGVGPGQGKVFEIEGRRVGVYRDDQGDLHIVDTTCGHMGCEVHWNDAEISWDCPCHGSRYSIDGEIIEGPSFKALKKLN